MTMASAPACCSPAAAAESAKKNRQPGWAAWIQARLRASSFFVRELPGEPGAPGVQDLPLHLLCLPYSTPWVTAMVVPSRTSANAVNSIADRLLF